MAIVTLTIEEVEEAAAAATMAAEFARENAEGFERYCEDEYAEEARADEERFEALAARLAALLDVAKAPNAAQPDPQRARE